MKANELRIHNIVIFESDLMFVKEITPIRVDLSFNKSDAVYSVDMDDEDLKPLPLTEEWLLKLGFEPKSHTWFDKSVSENYLWLGRYYICFDGDVFSLGRNDTTQNKPEYLAILTYVHQLQNLFFALTGEELTMKER